MSLAAKAMAAASSLVACCSQSTWIQLIFFFYKKYKNRLIFRLSSLSLVRSWVPNIEEAIINKIMSISKKT
jgi:hypothetical protein